MKSSTLLKTAALCLTAALAPSCASVQQKPSTLYEPSDAVFKEHFRDWLKIELQRRFLNAEDMSESVVFDAYRKRMEVVFGHYDGGIQSDGSSLKCSFPGTGERISQAEWTGLHKSALAELSQESGGQLADDSVNCFSTGYDGLRCTQCEPK